MSEKSPKRLKLEALLADEPGDAFLRYGLAVQCLRDGDVPEGRRRLLELIADKPDEAAAYQQLGQSYLESDEPDQARPILERGIAQARAKGDLHAAGEMRGLLSMIG